MLRLVLDRLGVVVDTQKGEETTAFPGVAVVCFFPRYLRYVDVEV